MAKKKAAKKKAAKKKTAKKKAKRKVAKKKGCQEALDWLLLVKGALAPPFFCSFPLLPRG